MRGDHRDLSLRLILEGDFGFREQMNMFHLVSSLLNKVLGV